MTVTLAVYEADNATLVGTLAAGEWASADVDVAPLKGLATVVLPRYIHNGVPNPALALLADGRLIRFTGDFGAWTMEIEDVDDQVVSESEEAGETVTITGRDWLTARAAKTHLLPDAGMGNLPHYPTRWFNFSADRLRDDDPDGPQGVWPFGTEQAPNYDTDNYFGRAEGYVDTSGEWIADRDSRTAYAPAGVWYFRQYVTLAESYDATLNQFACDDEGELWIDNVPVCRAEGVYLGGCVQSVVPMAAGEHLISGWVRNLNALRTGAVAAGWTMSDGMADTLLWRLDDTCRVLGFPAVPPGFTPTEVIRLVVDEEQDVGGLPGVGFSFISATDTASQPLTEVTDIATRAPGSSLLTFLQLLAASYLDIDCDPESLEMDAWVRGTRGQDLTETVTLEKGTAVSVKHTAQGSSRATCALVEGSSFAPFEVQHDDYDTLGRTTVALDFGEASKATATKWAGEYLDTVAEGRRGIEVKIHPAGPYLPGRDFDIGDRIGIEGGNSSTPTNIIQWDGQDAEWDGEPATWGPNLAGNRVSGWGFEIGADSVVRYNVELDQPKVLIEERIDAIMRRQLPGGAGGRTILPSPVEPSFPSQDKGTEKEKTWSAPDLFAPVELQKNGVTIATLNDTGRVTLTDNAARKYVKGVDGFKVLFDGVDDMPAAWVPETGRWIQSMAIVQEEGGNVVQVFYV